MMTFDFFKATIQRNADHLYSVDWNYLNEEGRKARTWYSKLDTILDLCDSFGDLDKAIMVEDSDTFDDEQKKIIRKWAKEERKASSAR